MLTVKILRFRSVLQHRHDSNHWWTCQHIPGCSLTQFPSNLHQCFVLCILSLLFLKIVFADINTDIRITNPASVQHISTSLLPRQPATLAFFPFFFATSPLSFFSHSLLQVLQSFLIQCKNMRFYHLLLLFCPVNYNIWIQDTLNLFFVSYHHLIRQLIIFKT